MAVFILLPVAGTFITSMFRDVAFLEKEFIGLANYRGLFQERRFLYALRFTLLFTAVTVPVEMLLGTLFAMILNERIPFRGILRACIILPWAIPAAISARTWELIYNYSYGLANFLIIRSGLSNVPLNWLGTEMGAFFSIVIADVWKTTPFVLIIILAGLQAIPDELYKQAQVDGTTFLHRFYLITLPLLKPVLVVALLFRTIDALRVFDIIYVLTNGGPGGATSSLSIYGYKFFLSGDWGYGSAVSVALFLIAFGLSIIYVRLGDWGSVVA
ncbi:MAG: carbohydrate ABC transporter permease [bacterium]